MSSRPVTIWNRSLDHGVSGYEKMRPLPKSSLLIDLQQNRAGLIADVIVLLLFVVLMAIR